jgi:hypothetical protein
MGECRNDTHTFTYQYRIGIVISLLARTLQRGCPPVQKIFDPANISLVMYSPSNILPLRAVPGQPLGTPLVEGSMRICKSNSNTMKDRDIFLENEMNHFVRR